MTALLVIAAWLSLAAIIGGVWVGACVWYDARAARRQRRGGFIR